MEVVGTLVRVVRESFRYSIMCTLIAEMANIRMNDDSNSKTSTAERNENEIKHDHIHDADN